MQITITYPEGWSEIKYIDYMKYYNAVKPYQGTEKETQKSLEAGALYFCKVPAEYLYKIPKENLNKIEKCLINLMHQANESSLVNQFELFDVKYAITPDLNDISYGEYLDLVSYSSKDLWNNIPIFLSILYRPVKYSLGKNYTITSYSGTNDTTITMFKEMITMDIVFGAVAFFLNLYLDLTTGTLLYLKDSLIETKDSQILAQLQGLEENGLAITPLQLFPIMTSPNLIE